MPRLDANLSMLFTELPFPKRFAAARKAGFRGVEFFFPYSHAPAEITGWLGEAGLRCVLFNAPPGDYQAGERGLASLPGRESEFLAGMTEAARYAKALGTSQIHVMAGIVPHSADRRLYVDRYIANLRSAARAVRAAGLTLLIEPINHRDMPGYFLQTQVEAHEIREAVGEPNLKVQMDLYHAQIMEGDLTTLLRRYLPHIGHVQIASVPDRHEPDGGELNAGYLLALLDELGYSGWVGCEYHPKGLTEDGLRWIEALGLNQED